MRLQDPPGQSRRQADFQQRFQELNETIETEQPLDALQDRKLGGIEGKPLRIEDQAGLNDVGQHAGDAGRNQDRRQGRSRRQHGRGRHVDAALPLQRHGVRRGEEWT